MLTLPAVVKSQFPPAVQSNYCFNPRPNTVKIAQSVESLLSTHDLLDTPLQRLPLHGNLLVPSTHPDAGKGQPLNWVTRISGLLSQAHMDRILDSLDHADNVGCKAFCKSGERTKGLAPHHPGVFFRASQINKPWISRDLLQPATAQSDKGKGKVSPVEVERKDAMIRLVMALDSVVNGRVQRLLRRTDKATWLLCHR